MSPLNVRSTDPLSVALLGTRGVPARYGGFETAIEEVGRRLSDRGHQVVVYCRQPDGGSDRPSEYLGMKLVHLPAMRRRTLETLSHTGLSAAHLLAHKTDAALVFNAANAPWLPLLRVARIPVATHVDGLEWQRAKWGPVGSRYYRACEAMAVRWSDALIADAEGIADYYSEEFGAPTSLITYGAPLLEPGHSHRLPELGLQSGAYHLVVARFEPENHVDVIVDGYSRSSSRLPLVVVGSAPYSDEYTRKVRSLADGRVRFLGGVWDQEQLDQLYANAAVYWHGHSVGGTNPSLLRALGAGTAVNALDVGFNREVLRGAGEYFKEANDIPALVQAAEDDRPALAARAAQSRTEALRYDWDIVADDYEKLCYELRDRGHRRIGGGRRISRSAEPIPTR
ncbi:DUF1972 domain-containing protein [Arthrobacter sp.]|uniref:DUF1972 domain-containing protein n=1 Tax=Arthrobacter sp. TaxID=1667 RepID=UPI003A93891D